jgi:AbrB family looped-hinge helix DNA binding protein
MKATITSKGQITIPLAIRRRLKLEPGQVLEFDEHAPYLKATKQVDLATMRSAIGMGSGDPSRLSADEWLNDLRGTVALPPRQGNAVRRKGRHKD